MSVLVVAISLILVTVTSCFEVVAPVIKTVGKSHFILYKLLYEIIIIIYQHLFLFLYIISPTYYESTSVCAYLYIYFSFALPLMHVSYVNRKPLHTIKARFCQIRSKRCSNSILNFGQK